MIVIVDIIHNTSISTSSSNQAVAAEPSYEHLMNDKSDQSIIGRKIQCANRVILATRETLAAEIAIGRRIIVNVMVVVTHGRCLLVVASTTITIIIDIIFDDN